MSPAPSDMETTPPLRLPFYRRFGVKLITALILLNLSVLGGSAYLSLHIIGHGFKQVVSAEIHSTLSFSQNFLTSSGRNVGGWVKHFTLDEQEHGLGLIVATQNRSDIRKYLHEHLPSSFAGTVTILDLNGRVLYRTHSPSEYGDLLKRVEIVRDALEQGTIGQSIVNDLNRFVLYSAGPIYAHDKMVGVLMIGTEVDDPFVEQVKGGATLDLAVVRDRAVMGTTFKNSDGTPIRDLPMPYLEYQLMLKKPGQVIETRFLGQRYFVATQPLTMMDGTTPGSLFLAVPRLKLDEIEDEILHQFWILLLIAMVLTVFLGTSISYRLTRPLSDLTEKTKAIASGDHDVTSDHVSKDELGILSDSFNEMQASIREKNLKLEAYSRDLEATVEQRTAELKITNSELQNSKIEAEMANKAKSEFLASMSHELRTPLNAILGFAQLLQLDAKTPLTERQNGNVEHIINGGNHLLQLINEILDLAKIEANRVDFNIQTINANEVIEDCVTMTMPLANLRSISVTNRAEGAEPQFLKTDAMRLKQVLINLLSNAVKYNRDNGTVSLETQATPDDYLRISVTDTGIGIAEHNFPYVFEKFHRLGTDSAIAKEGTGIGLTVTKLLVERLHGRIGFSSEENFGSTFWIELPLASNTDVTFI